MFPKDLCLYTLYTVSADVPVQDTKSWKAELSPYPELIRGIIFFILSDNGEIHFQAYK